MFADARDFEGEGKYPIEAYSEFMPPSRIGLNPYTGENTGFFSDRDPWGWPVTEYEEAFELQPGMQLIAQQILGALVRLGRGEPAHGISANILNGNPYWPYELAHSPGALSHERFVILLPLAFSRTLDDKGRVRWTLFGSSEQGPARAFWQGFFSAPGREVPREEAMLFLRRLIAEAYDEPPDALGDLGRAGFRIFAAGGNSRLNAWQAALLPSWTSSYCWTAGQTLAGVKYLLTFEPFGRLPAEVREAYLAGRLHLLPFPGSLLFWGASPYEQLRRELPFAHQIPLLHSVARHEAPRGVRIPQAGWMHEPRPGKLDPEGVHGPVRNTYIRTHRWARVHRHEDELTLLAKEDKIAHVLFSTLPDDVELYGKPMARNVQLWTHDYHLLLDGPGAADRDIQRAFQSLGEGGMFGYRFYFPPMRVGRHDVYWHRPLAAFHSPETSKSVLIRSAPAGYLTAYRADRVDLERPVELWPRLLRREGHLAAVGLSAHSEDVHPNQTALNVRKLLDAAELLGKDSLPRTYARRLLTLGSRHTLDDWLKSLPERAGDPQGGQRLAGDLERLIEAHPGSLPRRKGSRLPRSLTFDFTARRSFEVRYWTTIRMLAAGEFINKCNADCIQDKLTQQTLRHHQRDLEALGDYLLSYYKRVISSQGMTGKVLTGELPFRWKTDFDFDWYGGWRDNRLGRTYERNLMVMIPGRDRRRAVVMADHYDTAYMEDVYDRSRGGTGARLAAAGADDNHSATAALMLAAPVFCRLSREGKLGCDVWLVHLTGEEFPSDCMGARDLASKLVERTLQFHVAGGRRRDLSRARIEGVYVLDMVAHNNDRDRDIFQIAPGAGAGSARLSYHAHCANETWNASAGIWNQRSSRRGRARGRRSRDGITIPGIALHPELHGEVRPHYDPRSTLYNTDGQIFSDAGIPVVLFMENYDINRKGYHDSHDTMENIDLDYGSALAAIATESVARAANEA